MFSILLVASFVLPTVLGGCCLPDRIKAIQFVAGSPVPQTLLVDFKVNKIITRPEGGDVVYTVTDMGKQQVYTRFADKSCRKVPQPFPFTQCISGPPAGGATLAGAVVTGYSVNPGSMGILVDHECMPVITTQMINGASLTNVYVNATSSVSDEEVKDLNQDVSDCTIAEN